MAMENLETLLTQWRSIEPQSINIGRIKIDPVYQPRNKVLVPFRERIRFNKTSEQHIADLAIKLQGGDLEPVLVARIDGKLKLIDGHHRVTAYRNAHRTDIPARIRDSTEMAALMASKSVNCDGVKLRMHNEQRKEGAWQYLALKTGRGKRDFPAGISLRGIARTFAIGHDTVARMRKHLLKVKRADFNREQCDPGTGWPQWRHVRGNAIRDRFADVDVEIREQHRIEKMAARLGKEIDTHGEEAFIAALHLLEREAVDEAIDQLADADERFREAKESYTEQLKEKAVSAPLAEGK